MKNLDYSSVLNESGSVKTGTDRIYSNVLNRDLDFYFEGNYIFPDLEFSEESLSEDVIEEIKRIDRSL